VAGPATSDGSTPIRASIDAGALRHNLGRVRELAPGSRVMAVIKANGYGHGLETVARALDGADGLAVARLDEALALRAAGIGSRILLLEGVYDAAQLAAAAQARVDVMVHCAEQLAILEQRDGREPIGAWLKVDTGMNRLGFRPGDCRAAHARLLAVPGLAGEVVVATHFAASEDAADPSTAAQIESFSAATAGLPGPRSLANSAGVLHWPASHADWVRPGIMLYGITPGTTGSGSDLGLRPAMRLSTRVIAVRDVRAGEAVGYNGTWRAERDARIAVVAAGYGDGYPRSAPPGTPVRLNGVRRPLAGRVSMDMLTVDVTGGDPVRVGDPVELWGPGNPVEAVARAAGTIGYELTCRVSSRVPRAGL
jgi:alanine racemase